MTTYNMKEIEEKELTSIKNALTRYNEAKTESAKDRARFSVNLIINNVQIRIEQAISNLSSDNLSDAREIERLRNYYDSIEKMMIRNK